jgi:hypothetical protein
MFMKRYPYRLRSGGLGPYALVWTSAGDLIKRDGSNAEGG